MNKARIAVVFVLFLFLLTANAVKVLAQIPGDVMDLFNDTVLVIILIAVIASVILVGTYLAMRHGRKEMKKGAVRCIYCGKENPIDADSCSKCERSLKNQDPHNL